MFILAIIGYTLFLIFHMDVAHWLKDINSTYLGFAWLYHLANDIKGKGAIGTIVWMTPFFILAVYGSVKTGFTGTSFKE